MERCLWESARKAAVPSFGVLRRDRTDRLRSDWGPPREKTAPNGSTRGTLVYTSLGWEAKTKISDKSKIGETLLRLLEEP